MIFSVETIYEAYTSFKEQLLPITIKKKKNLKNMLMTLKNGSRPLKEFKRIEKHM